MGTKLWVAYDERQLATEMILYYNSLAVWVAGMMSIWGFVTMTLKSNSYHCFPMVSIHHCTLILRGLKSPSFILNKWGNFLRGQIRWTATVTSVRMHWSVFTLLYNLFTMPVCVQPPG